MNRYTHRMSLISTAVATAMAFSTSMVYAQQTDASTDEQEVEKIAVTGTQIRGIAPTGTNTVGMSAEDIKESGALSSNQILSQIPQVSSAFNQVPVLPPLDPGVSIIRPNLRNLGAAGATTTLVLIDGHRVVNAGILQTSPDPDVIPPGVLEAVDVMPDGGSSIYGSDAVGGVINFITKKRFDGFQVDARSGFGDNYNSLDANITFGKDWGDGGAYISYGYAQHDDIQGKDRSYIQQISDNAGNCAPGTVYVDRDGVTTSYALPSLTPGSVTECDNLDNMSIIPEEERNSLFAVVNQEINSSTEFDLRAFYTERESTGIIDMNLPGDFAKTVSITSANPYYMPIGDDPGSQTIRLSYAGLGVDQRINTLTEYGITPSVTIDLSNDWQIRGLLNYGKSETKQTQPFINVIEQNAALESTDIATALNPYDLGATNSAVLNKVLTTNLASAEQTLTNARVIADGDLFEVSGGDAKLAMGAEFIRETLDNTFVDPVSSTSTSSSRNVSSAFAEIAVPLVSSMNEMAGIKNLMVSASIRYDDYSDVGGTTNPKIGVTYSPTDELTVRANWGKSFNAPSLADTKGAPDTRTILIAGAVPFYDPSDDISVRDGRSQLLIAGGNPELGPQKAETWSLGFDVYVPQIEGLSLSATYYNIELVDQITIVPFFSADAYLPVFSQWVVKDPSFDYVSNLIGDMRLENGTSLAEFYEDYGVPYSIIDARRQNLGQVKQNGIDFNANYDTYTDFGSVFASIGGTYTLKRDLAGVAGGKFTDAVSSPGISRLSLAATFGVEVGDLYGSATVRHSAGYDLNPSVGSQTSVDAFTVVDLFVKYDMAGSGFAEDLSFTVNVSNLLDEEPPFYNRDPGFTNGSTIGRVVQVGFSKLF